MFDDLEIHKIQRRDKNADPPAPRERQTGIVLNQNFRLKLFLGIISDLNFDDELNLHTSKKQKYLRILIFNLKKFAKSA